MQINLYIESVVLRNERYIYLCVSMTVTLLPFINTKIENAFINSWILDHYTIKNAHHIVFIDLLDQRGYKLVW